MRVIWSLKSLVGARVPIMWRSRKRSLRAWSMSSLSSLWRSASNSASDWRKMRNLEADSTTEAGHKSSRTDSFRTPTSRSCHKYFTAWRETSASSRVSKCSSWQCSYSKSPVRAVYLYCSASRKIDLSKSSSTGFLRRMWPRMRLQQSYSCWLATQLPLKEPYTCPETTF